MRRAAVIEIGSTGIRLLVAEFLEESGEWKILDQAGRPAALGREVFNSGVMGREAFVECISILQAFREQLGAWGLPEEEIHLIATSAIRSARNRDVFSDRLRRETGKQLTVIEGIEENRLMYLAVRNALKNDLPQFWRANSMILDVGGGSTEIMLLRRGKIVAAHSLRLGTILIDQKGRQGPGSAHFIQRFLNENVRNTQELLNEEMELGYIRTLAATGSDVRIAALRRGSVLNEKTRIISRDDFFKFVAEVENYSIEDCVKKLGIPYADAEGFAPGLQLYRTFLERIPAESLVVPSVSIREGYLIDLARGFDRELQDDFYSQTVASAVNLGRKYHFDEAHSRHVAFLSLKLFDALEKVHGMSERERLLLETSGILHDIGMFIRSSRHHRHGQYIVSNAEIFGLRQEDLDIIGNVIRYHRDELPSQTDVEYIALQREDRILVLKMAALIRVADALDRGHSQRIKDISADVRGETVMLRTGENFDLSLEQIGLAEKADLFQEVFGYRVILL